MTSLVPFRKATARRKLGRSNVPGPPRLSLMSLHPSVDSRHKSALSSFCYAFYLSRKHMNYIVISLLVLTSALAEAKIPNSAWKSGVLKRVSKEHVARRSGELGKKPPKHGVYISYYFIQSDKSLYEGDDVRLKNNEKGFPISVKAPVKFFLDANDLYIQDDKGKAHKLRLVNVLPTETTAAE